MLSDAGRVFLGVTVGFRRPASLALLEDLDVNGFERASVVPRSQQLCLASCHNLQVFVLGSWVVDGLVNGAGPCTG